MNTSKLGLWIFLGLVIIGVIALAVVKEPESLVDKKMAEFSKQLDLDYDQLVVDMETVATSDKITALHQSGTDLNVTGTPTFYLDGEKLGIAEIMTRLESGTESTFDTTTLSEAGQIALALREDDDMLVGANSAHTVIEYGDYRCGACAQAHPQVKDLLEQHGDKITFVYRPFSVGFPHSIKAARIAEAAGQQGKFWEMHDLLFDKQKSF